VKLTAKLQKMFDQLKGDYKFLIVGRDKYGITFGAVFNEFDEICIKGSDYEYLRFKSAGELKKHNAELYAKLTAEVEKFSDKDGSFYLSNNKTILAPYEAEAFIASSFLENSLKNHSGFCTIDDAINLLNNFPDSPSGLEKTILGFLLSYVTSDTKKTVKKVLYKDLADYLGVTEQAVKQYDPIKRELMLLGLQKKREDEDDGV
jgi:hypothetical protein